MQNAAAFGDSSKCTTPCRQVYHTQQRTATDEPALGLQRFWRPTDRLFVDRKRLCRAPKPWRESKLYVHARSIATSGSYHQSLMDIHGHGAEIAHHPGGTFTWLPKGRPRQSSWSVAKELKCEKESYDELEIIIAKVPFRTRTYAKMTP